MMIPGVAKAGGTTVIATDASPTTPSLAPSAGGTETGGGGEWPEPRQGGTSGDPGAPSGGNGAQAASQPTSPVASPGGPPQAAASPSESPTAPSWYNLHGQATVISQKHDAFHSAYSGQNSLERVEGFKTSITATLFMGARLPWAGGEAYFDPEIAGGEGFSGVLGIAGFPNGEIPRVGTPDPEPYIGRLFLKQTFGFGGETENVQDVLNQLPGKRDVSRLTVIAGKFGADDYFQQSAYSNDPRSQFENWALFAPGAWDYPADTRGYTEGLLLELNQPAWSLRYGAMAEPKTANGGTYDSRVLDALAHSLEYEQRWTIGTHAGSAKIMAFLNRSHAGKYALAIDHFGPAGPDVTQTRSFRDKYGLSVTADQEIFDDLGLFARGSWNDGHSESWAFTEIDRSLSLGMSLKGTRWNRPDDVVGLAGVINLLAAEHRRYLGLGGYGFIIGDGQLPHYAPEQIIEAYYLWKLDDHVFVTPDVQLIDHPAYNADRGPVFVGGLRVHIEF